MVEPKTRVGPISFFLCILKSLKSPPLTLWGVAQVHNSAVFDPPCRRLPIFPWKKTLILVGFPPLRSWWWVSFFGEISLCVYAPDYYLDFQGPPPPSISHAFVSFVSSGCDRSQKRSYHLYPKCSQEHKRGGGKRKKNVCHSSFFLEFPL